ncbi:hypothetical protein [Aquimarina sp. AU474]|uniref:hypothetical protein n=1 Tax=Aquimarina sp. AU474 TaxID=2108529 RepID=UPI000D690065|nr:hypothetical protein [Aquimarina sp. AU474]
MDNFLIIKTTLNYKKIKELLGTYQMANHSKVVEIRLFEDILMVYFPETQGTEVQIKAIDQDKFKSTEANIEPTFLRNDKDEVIGITANQNGITKWLKIK